MACFSKGTGYQKSLAGCQERRFKDSLGVEVIDSSSDEATQISTGSMFERQNRQKTGKYTLLNDALYRPKHSLHPPPAMRLLTEPICTGGTLNPLPSIFAIIITTKTLLFPIFPYPMSSPPSNNNPHSTCSNRRRHHSLLRQRSNSRDTQDCRVLADLIAKCGDLEKRTPHSAFSGLLLFFFTMTCCGGPCWYCI